LKLVHNVLKQKDMQKHQIQMLVLPALTDVLHA